VHEEIDMDIIYAAEKPSIAKLLSRHTRKLVEPDDIQVTESPDRTGSFRIDWRFRQYLLAPNGAIAPFSES
jgi:hypothetical protein